MYTLERYNRGNYLWATCIMAQLRHPAEFLGGSWPTWPTQSAPVAMFAHTFARGHSRAVFSRRRQVFHRPRVPYYHLGHRYQRLVIGEKTSWCRLLSPPVSRHGIGLRSPSAPVSCKLFSVICMLLLHWRNKR